MRRILILFSLLFPALAFAGKYYNGSSWVDTTRKYYNGSSWVTTTTKRWDGAQWVTLGGGSSCAASAFLTSSAQTSVQQIIQSTTAAKIGNIWTGAGFTLCKASVYARTWLGDVTGKTYRMEVWSRSGTALDTLKGASDNRAGSIFTGTITEHEFTFSTPVAVATGDVIVFTDTSNTVDTSNFIRVYYGSADTDADFVLFSTTGTQSTTSDILMNAGSYWAYE